jgi:RNA ligase (TIGR02306 family)
MAEIFVEVSTIDKIFPHPNADSLYLAEIKGWQTVIVKNPDGSPQFNEGEAVVFVPPNVIVPPELAEELKITNYLKSRVDINGDKVLVLHAVRLRGEASFGLVLPVKDKSWKVGQEVSTEYGLYKYNPPVRPFSLTKQRTDAAPELPEFPRYSSSDNLRHYKLLFEEFIAANKMDIVATEKIHGTNSGVGIVNGVLVARSNGYRRKDPTGLTPEEIENSKQRDQNETNSAYSANIWWYPHSLPQIQTFLQEMGKLHRSVIVYGEIFGPGVNNFKYGRTSIDYRVFDIMIDGKYLDFKDALSLCVTYNLPYVPILYIGEYNFERIKELSQGKTTLADENSKTTNIREGVVIRPVKESYLPNIGRLTLKFVSDDYLTDKKIQDNDSTDM